MVKRYLGATIIVVVVIVLTQRIGSNCLPFKASDVSCIRFHYSFLDSEQIVVRDSAQVASIMDKLRVKPGKDEGMYWALPDFVWVA